MDQENQIYIGCVDEEEIADTDHQYHYTDNRIGGCPIFANRETLEAIRAKIICRNCGKISTFMLQISCPVDQSTNDRVLYFFACLNVHCGEKEYFVFRVLTPNTASSIAEREQMAKSEKLFDDEWEIDQDQDRDQDDDDKLLASAFQKNINLNDDDDEKSHHLRGDCVRFKSRYISVFEEPAKVSNLSKIEKDRLRIITEGDQSIDEDDQRKSTSNGECYEKTYSPAFVNDIANYHFYKRISRCPEQVIRYEWRGEPLWCSEIDRVKTRAKLCENCGAKRVFELQLMPALIEIVRRLTSDSKNRSSIDLDFETIILYSCENNCSTNSGDGKLLSSSSYNQREQVFVFKEKYKL